MSKADICSCERIRRKGDIETIDLAFIDDDVPIPAQMDKFWPSATNKENLQVILRRLALVKFEDVVRGSMVVDEEMMKAISKGKDEIDVEEINSWEEEADCKIINHAMWSVKNGRKRLIILSNDSDTLILLLSYIERFLSNGLKEVWIRYGNGENKRMILLHS